MTLTSLYRLTPLMLLSLAACEDDDAADANLAVTADNLSANTWVYQSRTALGVTTSQNICPQELTFDSTTLAIGSIPEDDPCVSFGASAEAVPYQLRGDTVVLLGIDIPEYQVVKLTGSELQLRSEVGEVRFQENFVAK